MVCTTIKPSSIGCQHDGLVNNLRSIARFVSEYVRYIPEKKRPTEPPEVLTGPHMTLTTQEGDSFDMAHLLCSLLVGAGYDAYCVYGTAERTVCEMDRREETCPLLAKDETEGETTSVGPETNVSESSESPYNIAKRFDFHSKFQLALERKRRRRRERADREREELMREDEPAKTVDPLRGKRVHCWVLVKSSLIRALDDDDVNAVFVEPTTGRVYPCTSPSPYLGVRSVWNARNCWISVQSDDAMRDASFFDLTAERDDESTRRWHHVFSGPRTASDERHPSGSMERGASGVMMRATSGVMMQRVDSNVLDARSGSMVSKASHETSSPPTIVVPPMSWVRTIEIPTYRRQNRFGKGKVKRTTLFRKAKLEEFARGSQSSGLVSRVTVYEDRERYVPVEIRETYANRSDKLVERTTRTLESITRDRYAPGHAFAVKEIEQQMGSHVTIRFYPDARLDGLVERSDVFGEKMTETFEGRDDCLTYRSVTLVKPSEGERSEQDTTEVVFTLPGGASPQDGEDVIRKMAQKYDPVPGTTRGECVAKRTFLVLPRKDESADGTPVIVERFHFAEGKIDARVWTYSKRSSDEDDLERDVERGVERDTRSASKSTRRRVDEEKRRRRVLAEKAEKSCYQSVRQSKHETEDILNARWTCEHNVDVVGNIFERVREKMHHEREVREGRRSGAFRSGSGATDKGDANAETASATSIDYLTPYLPQEGNRPIEVMTVEEAKSANDNCLKALKERLVERANIIQRRLDKENEALAKRQAAFQRSRDATEGADEEYEKFCVDAMFRIQILEQRLQKHEDTAMSKYEALIRKLQEDPRLAVLKQPHAGSVK